MARFIIFGPIERMKIITQTKHMTMYANPRSDMPINFPDLVGKIATN